MIFPTYTSATSRFSSNMNLIVDKNEFEGAIYLGNLEAASNLEYLKRHNIGAILTVAEGTGLRYSIHDIPMHEIINVDDALYENLSQYFNRMIKFIENSRQKTNILIHCYAGISRSVTALAAYLMQKQKWTYERTISFIRAQRSIANPNPAFVRQLKDFEKSINSIQSRNLSASQSTKLLSYSKNQHSASKTKQLIDDLFDSPPKHASMSYERRNLSTINYQPKPTPFLTQNQIDSLYSSPNLRKNLDSYNKSYLSRNIFQSVNNYPSSHLQLNSTSQSPSFLNEKKIDNQLSRFQTSSASKRPFYSKIIC